jgi:hypothetical protein
MQMVCIWTYVKLLIESERTEMTLDRPTRRLEENMKIL